MPITRTQQKILDKEMDFNRKDEHNNKVTIIKKWGESDRYLDQCINNSEKWENLNKYNLLYVLQNKASRQKHVFKIGISTGNFRLKNYMDYNGGITDTPTRLAIWLWEHLMHVLVVQEFIHGISQDKRIN